MEGAIEIEFCDDEGDITASLKDQKEFLLKEGYKEEDIEKHLINPGEDISKLVKKEKIKDIRVFIGVFEFVQLGQDAVEGNFPFKIINGIVDVSS